MSLVLIFLGLTLLVVGGEYLVRSSVALSFKLKISKLVIGMTVVSFATSAPELWVSLTAALEGSTDIALGNVIGSNIANIGLVLAITSIISPLIVNRDFYKYNWPMMVFMSVLVYWLLTSGNSLEAIEGVLLVTLLVIFLFILIRGSRKRTKINIEEVDEALAETSNFKIAIWLLIGAAALYYGSEWLVSGSRTLAAYLGVSEFAISVSVIAIGTSVPELAASVIAALRREKAISLGNLIGSNIFNLASVLGITSIIKPIHVNPETPQILETDIIWMIGFAIALVPLSLIPVRYEISRYKGFIILGGYIFFLYLAFK
ncbi:calcium/sodium antiporter [Aegicerativicinus sediminis]|uniref:calcium/sodium antiporter n=1 Tax=Aegicerativicinus sediminis TaxID=2893202 RepID=UPI001E43FF2B|nr:calcium/sodium antiporter [Aegicerativicinus sediminis]